MQCTEFTLGISLLLNLASCLPFCSLIPPLSVYLFNCLHFTLYNHWEIEGKVQVTTLGGSFSVLSDMQWCSFSSVACCQNHLVWRGSRGHILPSSLRPKPPQSSKFCVSDQSKGVQKTINFWFSTSPKGYFVYSLKQIWQKLMVEISF